MTSIDADVMYAAVNAGAPHFTAARRLVESLMRSTELVLLEPVLIQLYGAVAKKSAADASKVIRAIRQNPHWRIVDVQSNRVMMNGIWEAVLAGEEDLTAIHRRRLVALLEQSGVDRFYTLQADLYRSLGYEGALNLPGCVL